MRDNYYKELWETLKKLLIFELKDNTVKFDKEETINEYTPSKDLFDIGKHRYRIEVKRGFLDKMKSLENEKPIIIFRVYGDDIDTAYQLKTFLVKKETK